MQDLNEIFVIVLKINLHIWIDGDLLIKACSNYNLNLKIQIFLPIRLRVNNLERRGVSPLCLSLLYTRYYVIHPCYLIQYGAWRVTNRARVYSREQCGVYSNGSGGRALFSETDLNSLIGRNFNNFLWENDLFATYNSLWTFYRIAKWNT